MKSRTLAEANEYSIDVLREILTDLRPYVWMVGSYANDCHRDVSDIDLMPRRKPYAEYIEDDNEQEYYYKEIREILNKWGLENERDPDDSTYFAWGVFWHRTIDIYEFPIPKDAVKVTKTITYLGVEMDCLEYDTDIDGFELDECFEWDWEDWEFE